MVERKKKKETMKKNFGIVLLSLGLLGCSVTVDHDCDAGVTDSTAVLCSDDTLVIARHDLATADSDGADILKQEAVDQANVLGCGVTLYEVLPSAVPGVSQVPVECCVDMIRTSSNCTEIGAAVDACDALVR